MPRFVPDCALDYASQATSLPPGHGLALDESYRRAHLPLVAPDHPGVIPEDAARGYRMGRHETVWSLVIPVPWDTLAGSAAFRRLDAAMRGSPLSAKVAWTVFEQRKPLLHATICGGLGRGAPPVLTPAQHQALARTPPFAVEVRGLFSGSVNRGRLYLKLYPEMRAGRNSIRALQAGLGRPETALYVIGLYNLCDDLTVEETRWLATILAEFEHEDFATVTAHELGLLGTRDDLALDSEVAERVRLG